MLTVVLLAANVLGLADVLELIFSQLTERHQCAG